MNSKIIIPILVGPTAVGKTAISIPLARKMNAEIISADSRQIFKHMNIGTAKPSGDELDAVLHHLVDILELDEVFTAGQFAEDALKIIEDILARGKAPLIVGGSGFYIKALVAGIFDTPSRDDEVREALQTEADERGSQALYSRLRNIDPEYAETMHPNNTRRIIRALEIYEVTGEPPAEHFEEEHEGLRYPYTFIGLKRPRQKLYDRINRRVEQMIEDGLVQEVQSILGIGYTGEENALQTVGYQEIFDYLNENISLEEARKEIQKNTRRYAKRQMTWFRNQHDVTWFDLDKYPNQELVVEAILEFLKSNTE
ncbi:MAG: tRNA dimethylallyltransferase [Candidatus Marinimicrobia bacterium]|nr:tRNA dimethylallyltransferase [Candidatus Neomarinimicrobiota bacterium]